MKKSNILAHRGLWKENKLIKNSKSALFKALEEGFGIETDIRDGEASIEVRHDPFVKGWDLEDLLYEYKTKGYKSSLALNVKSDGLGPSLKDLLKKYEIDNYFAFDMNLPDHISINSNNIKNLIRISEYETNQIFLKNTIGYWIDPLTNSNNIERLAPISFFKKNTIYSFVSPELHGNLVTKKFLKYLREILKIHKYSSIKICTDLPYFYVE